MNRIELHPCAAPQRLARPDHFVAAAVSVDIGGDAIRLLLEAGSRGELISAGKPPLGEYSAIVAVSGDSWSSETCLSGVTAAFPKIDLLPEHEILVVTPRCRRFLDDTHEMNARVYDPDGKPRREFLLGDGVSHVQTDARGNIWVGYFDEGVFGNYGWKTPVGAAGLSCFRNSGEKIWDFEAPSGFDEIADCYALNVGGGGAWCYYYTGFPIAHVDSNGRVRCWNTATSGASAFAVGNEKILLYGGYREQRNACKLLGLHDQNATIVAEVSLILPREIDLTRDRVIGRDKLLHAFLGDDWYVFSIDSLS
jgi:hypothetical protein